MKTNRSRMRLRVTSLVAGCAISGVLTAIVLATRTAFYFPPYWPGLFLAWIVIMFSQGGLGASHFGIILTTIGNAAFYGWVSLRLIEAEVLADGRVGKIFK